jgi:outer membrane receptor for ferrienterochelin and colicin
MQRQMKKFKLTPLAAASFLLSASALAQQTSTPTLQEIVVTASPIIESNNVDNFSGFTTRVTDAQVRDLGALDLAAALRMTPGVQISRYNEVGSYSGSEGGTVYIRGMGCEKNWAPTSNGVCPKKASGAGLFSGLCVTDPLLCLCLAQVALES